MKELKTEPRAWLEGVAAEIFTLPSQNTSRGEFIMWSQAMNVTEEWAAAL